MAIKKEIKDLIDTLQSKGIKLVAVSKTKPASEILALFEAGQLDFGENKVQELVDKQAALPPSIRWHMIGHLQRNKVKYIAPFIHLIHSVDSIKVLKEINKEALKNDRVINCLLQVHIAEEDSKFGFQEGEVQSLCASGVHLELKGIRICGLMGMATYTDNLQQISTEFKRLRTLRDLLKQEYFAEDPHFGELSMGMSSDFELAIQEGATMVRIGSMIFGSRN